ncbi:hypothetical protein RHMOL_Rhmol03G0168400 [Rhododendron molle]|uniref:Uncharacterized protein n=1 Tax=Rhododendron molle TaxID=49168 RepID=A0ACC0PFQ6_RHOML|nr:hypothetical protein RHMOL_Rhmol03G0168400 [Rhododendron molle]
MYQKGPNQTIDDRLVGVTCDKTMVAMFKMHKDNNSDVIDIYIHNPMMEHNKPSGEEVSTLTKVGLIVQTNDLIDLHDFDDIVDLDDIVNLNECIIPTGPFEGDDDSDKDWKIGDETDDESDGDSDDGTGDDTDDFSDFADSSKDEDEEKEVEQEFAIMTVNEEGECSDKSDDDQGFPEFNKQMAKMKRVDKKAHEWMLKEEKEVWAKAYYSSRSKVNRMDNNVIIKTHKVLPEDYVNDCYTTDAFVRTYSYRINPIPDKSLWPQTECDPIMPPPLRSTIARPKKARRKGEDEPNNPYKKAKFGGGAQPAGKPKSSGRRTIGRGSGAVSRGSETVDRGRGSGTGRGRGRGTGRGSGGGIESGSASAASVSVATGKRKAVDQPQQNQVFDLVLQLSTIH